MMLEGFGILLVFVGLILIFIGMISGRRVSEIDRSGEPFEGTEIRRHGLRERDIYDYNRDYEFEEYGGYGRYREHDWERKKKKIKGAGIIMIGPIPIIFGDSKYAFYLGIVAIILMVLSILLMFSFGFGVR